LKARGADIRHTSHGSPQTTFKYGKAAPVWGCSPNNEGLLVSYGGDCVTIEQYVFAKQTSPTMRCKGTQKTSIIATFSVT